MKTDDIFSPRDDVFLPVEEWPDEVQLYHNGRLEGRLQSGNRAGELWPLAFPVTGSKLRQLGYEMTNSHTGDSIFWKRHEI